MRRGLDLRDADVGVSAVPEPEFGRCRLAQVDDAPADEGSAVVNGDSDGIAGALVGDLHLGTERQALMRCRHGVLIESFARGGFLAVEAGPIPRGSPTLAVGESWGRHSEHRDGYEGGGNNGLQQSTFSLWFQ